MVDTVMAEDTVATNCTMSPGAATEVDMEVTNPVMLAGMEGTDVKSMEDTEVTNPGMVAGMADDTVATNCTMSPGAATEVDMEVTNPVMVAGMEVTDVISMEDTEVTNPGMVAGMADTEVTETVTADMGDTDTIRGR